MVLQHERLRHDGEDLARDVERQWVDDRQPVLALEVGEQLLLADEPEADEMRRQGTAVLALLLERLHELVGGEVAALLENLAETRRHYALLIWVSEGGGPGPYWRRRAGST